jgi:hypothetical protein
MVKETKESSCKTAASLTSEYQDSNREATLDNEAGEYKENTIPRINTKGL